MKQIIKIKKYINGKRDEENHLNRKEKLAKKKSKDERCKKTKEIYDGREKKKENRDEE